MNNHPNETSRQSGLSDPAASKRSCPPWVPTFPRRWGRISSSTPGVPRMAAECRAQGVPASSRWARVSGAYRELSRWRKVAAIELDSPAVPCAEEALSGRNNVKIVPGDVMKLDLKTLI